MRYLRLGRSELMVSQIGFGAIPIQRLTEREAIRVIQRSLDLGVNFIDTARGYGVSEGYVGKAIAGRRDEVVLATKSHSRDRDGLLRDLETSLRLLQTDTVELFMLHGVSDTETYEQVLGPSGALEGVRQAVRDGKAEHVGISCHSLDIARRAVRSGLFEAILFPLNFVAREPGEETYTLAREHDVGFMVMKPMGGGVLQDATLAFKYLMGFPDALLLTGIEKVEEIEEIVRIVAGSSELTPAERQEMERMRDELGPNFCRRCQYCQPCSQGIPIMQLMVAESHWKRLPVGSFINSYADAVKKAVEECIKCGECEDKCPYHLPIREMMDSAVALYQREQARYTSA